MLRAVADAMRCVTSLKMTDLLPDESVLLGNWTTEGRSVVPDDTSRRIDWLVRFRLERLAKDSSGWETLYRDPTDGRLWEHRYPQGEMHGGGPPQLRVISVNQAASKYDMRIE